MIFEDRKNEFTGNGAVVQESLWDRSSRLRKLGLVAASVALASACSGSPTPDAATGSETPAPIEQIQDGDIGENIPTTIGWVDQLVDKSQYEISAQTIYTLPELNLKMLNEALDASDESLLMPMFVDGNRGNDLADRLFDRFSDYSGGDYGVSIWLEERPDEIQGMLNNSGTIVRKDLSGAYLSFKIVISTDDIEAEIVDEQWAIFEYTNVSESKEDPNSWKISLVQFVNDTE